MDVKRYTSSKIMGAITLKRILSAQGRLPRYLYYLSRPFCNVDRVFCGGKLFGFVFTAMQLHACTVEARVCANVMSKTEGRAEGLEG